MSRLGEDGDATREDAPRVHLVDFNIFLRLPAAHVVEFAEQRERELIIIIIFSTAQQPSCFKCRIKLGWRGFIYFFSELRKRNSIVITDYRRRKAITNRCWCAGASILSFIRLTSILLYFHCLAILRSSNRT